VGRKIENLKKNKVRYYLSVETRHRSATNELVPVRADISANASTPRNFESKVKPPVAASFSWAAFGLDFAL
jgi:hypothetical protein